MIMRGYSSHGAAIHCAAEKGKAYNLFPMVWPTPFPITTKLFFGVEATRIELPVIPKKERKAPSFRTQKKRRSVPTLATSVAALGLWAFSSEEGTFGKGPWVLNGEKQAPGKLKAAVTTRPRKITMRQMKKIPLDRVFWARTATASNSPAGPSIC
jgi:hypothetical protein